MCYIKGLTLIRLAVNNNGQVVRDVTGKLKGRGAYICKFQICKDKLIKNKRLKKIFRTDRAICLGPDITE